MINKKTVLSLLIAFLMIFAAGCTAGGSKSENGTKTKSGKKNADNTFNLMYCYSDSFNPYAAKTKTNRELSLLLYDPLIKLDNNYKPVNYLAESVDFDGKNCKITLKSASFSDGSPVTAADVVYSVKLALDSETKYKERLSAVSSYRADGDRTVLFSASKNDPYFVNLLDFPIIKSGTAGQTDNNNIEIPPVGCGRYTIDIQKETLTANESHYIKAPEIKKISLVNAPDDEAVQHNLENGGVSFYYSDLSDGKTIKMAGGNQTVNLNNFVYIGINTKKGGVLSNEKMRYALSVGIDRKAIAKEAYFGNANPARGPYNPVWEDAKSCQNIEISQNIDVLVANLKEMGYNNKDADGIFVDGNGSKLSLKLICNSENNLRISAANMIAEQLKNAGVGVSVETLAWDSYVAAVTAGDFDLYIAETLIPNNMDISQLVVNGGALAFGINPNTDAGAADSNTENGAEDGSEPQAAGLISESVINSFYAGNASLKDVVSAFDADVSVIPVCYRTGYAVYSKNLKNGPKSSVSDLFFDFENCKFKND